MNYLKRYTEFLKTFLKPKFQTTIVLDPSNGATGPVLKELFKRNKDVRVKLINHKPDGSFPAHGPNPLAKGATDQAAKMVKKKKADLGAVFDSDGDRIIFIDDLGREVDAYEIFRILKRDFGPPYVLDARALSSFSFNDPNIVESKSGRYYMAKTMKEAEASLGVERSGHYSFKDFYYKDSAVLALIHMINKVSNLKESSSLSEELDKLPKLVRPREMNYKVDNPDPTIELVSNHFTQKGFKSSKMDGISIYGEEFAFNLRASATEPLIRLNIVAKNELVADNLKSEIERLINAKD